MSKALKNKTFISTRPVGQNKELSQLLEAEGASLIEMPTIEIKPSVLSLDDEDMLDHVNQFSWIVFTSVNGIRYFFEKLNEITGSYDLPSSMKTAVVGRKTSKVLSEYGHETTLENPGSTGEDLAQELLKAINQEDQILFPEGDLARGNISEILSPHAECVNMVVYKNSMPKNINKEHLNSIINNEYSHIILTSPSSFINLTKALKGKADLKQLRLICIGSTTASEVELNNIKPAAIARMSNAQGIFDSIVEIYTS